MTTIETIHHYLSNELSGEDRQRFEEQLRTDPALRAQLETEKDLLAGIRRKALRDKANKGYKIYKTYKALAASAVAIVSVTVIAAAAYYFVYKSHHAGESGYTLPELNEGGTKQWADADKNLPTQLFDIDNTRDTVIETDKGIVMAIPANCFTGQGGKTVTGPVQLELREALDAQDIMRGGLVTKSGDRLLETGGMFYLNARQDGKQLGFAAGKSILTEVPADNKKPGMQLFEGTRLADGTIDWVQPKPVETFLVPVDILSLNFYPPHYEDSLAAWGYDVSNKYFKDSLYYSFAYNMPEFEGELSVTRFAHSDTISVETLYIDDSGKLYPSKDSARHSSSNGRDLFNHNCAVCHSLTHLLLTGPGLEGVFDRVPKPADTWLKKFILNNEKVIKSGDAYARELSKHYSAMTVFEGQLSDPDLDALLAYIKDPNQSPREITPSKIKAIWDQKFNNTILATQEFEERLKYIHYSNSNAVLDLYVNHPGDRLSHIDSMAVNLVQPCLQQVFADFALRGDGRVKDGDRQVKKLQDYYRKKSEAYAKAIEKTQKAFWDRQSALGTKAMEREGEHAKHEGDRGGKTFQEELDVNLKEVYRQLGYEKPKINLPPAQTYVATVNTMGWKNIDAYVREATAKRESAVITYEGKSAKITYEPLSLQINTGDYDVSYAYLIPDRLNSFTRMLAQGSDFTGLHATGSVFKEKLNGFISYDLVCIAYKDKDIYFYKAMDVKPGDLGHIGLMKISKGELETQLNAMNRGTLREDLSEDYKYAKFYVQEQRRQKQISDILELRARAERVIFMHQCGSPVYPQQSPAAVAAKK